MSDADLITRLNAALERRYRIASELGGGGMATVYLAGSRLHHELSLHAGALEGEPCTSPHSTDYSMTVTDSEWAAVFLSHPMPRVT